MWRNNVPSISWHMRQRITQKEKKTELNVVLNESLNTINKGNWNKVSSVGIIFFMQKPHKIMNNLQRGITFLQINLEINLDSVRSKNERHDVLQQKFGDFFFFQFFVIIIQLYIFLSFLTLCGKGVEFNCHIANQIHLRINLIHKLNFCVLVMSLL